MFGWIAMLFWRETPSVGWGLPWQVRRGGAHLHILHYIYHYYNYYHHCYCYYYQYQSTGAIQPHRGPTGAPQGLSSPTGTIQPQKQTLARSHTKRISIYVYIYIYIYRYIYIYI
jgi:hypothetical protein